jgi:hypothetical protein
MFSPRIILTYSVLVLLLTASFSNMTRAESTTPSVQTFHENVLTATNLPPVFLFPKKFRFVAFGDYQGGTDVILKNLETSPVKPDFYVNTGDIATDQFNGFDRTNKLLYGKKLYPAKGNNDDGIWGNIYPLTGQSKDYYSFRYGNTHFVMLYSGAGDSPATQFPPKSPNPNCQTPANQTDWLDCELEKVRNDAAIDNIIVVLHAPPLTFGGNHPSSHNNPDSEYQRLVPILKTHPKLRAVLSGHNHFYQRLIKDNIHFFVIGGAGASLVPIPVSSPEIQNQASQYHFAIFDIDGSKVTVSVVGYIAKMQGFKTIETLDLGCITGVRKILCQNVKRVDIDEDCSTTPLP